jgi:alpha-mannosidase
MRVYFPTTLNAPYFTSETGFGAYKRPTVNSSKLEQEKFEVAAHRWIDLSETDYGVAVLNDSKYAHSVQYDTIGVTLLRSTSFPAKNADIGMHNFTSSLLPHLGSWEKAGVARAGIELKAEAHSMGAIGGGDLADSRFTCCNPNLVIDTVKIAENTDEIVVRLYETNGCSGTAVLNVGANVVSAVESDLIERKSGDVVLNNNAITFNFTPYEIKTFLIKL